MSACKICASESADTIEKSGILALGEEISWREAARRASEVFPIAGQSLKTHMERHYVDNVTERVIGEQTAKVEATVEELERQMFAAPAELKPLYAVAIHNLRGLMDTKPSQQHLIQALKSIHEITGMRIEQRLLLDYAKAAEFGPKKVASTHQPVIEIPAAETVEN